MQPTWALALVLLLSGPGDAQPRAGQAPSPGSSDLSRSLGVLREALHSRDYATRLFAVQALALVRAVDPVPWLERMLGDPEHDVRVAAIESLRKIGTTSARNALRSVRDDKTEALDIRALAAAALLERGREFPPADPP